MARVALACLLTVAAAASDVVGVTADGLPRGRNKPAFAFDPTRRTLVLFGGFGDRAAVLQDAWERTGEGWRPVQKSAFPPRAAAGVATDTRRGRVVLFGGDDEAGVCGDTLEWDGKAWKRVAWSGPPARTVPQLAYDSKRDRTVLFGGSDGKQTTFGDTWEWDGTLWTKLADSGPPPRYQHVMTYDAARGRVILFGGHPGGPYDAASWSKRVLGDTWEWDGARWTSAAGAGPSARDHHAMTYDESRAKVVMFGGWNGRFLADLWEWDGAWKQIEAQGPSARGGLPSLRYHPLWRTVVLYGGWGAKGPETDTWKWDGRTWARAE
jgi:hypothetical protein